MLIAQCQADFNCPKSAFALEYEFVTFDIEQDATCNYDLLGILFIHYLFQIE